MQILEESSQEQQPSIERLSSLLPQLSLAHKRIAMAFNTL